ncbi:MAG: formimidoylglutamate deiminase [Alphaproteobacteria bacterium]
MTILHCPSALLPDGWANDVLLDLGADGTIRGVKAESEPNGAERLAGPVVPGMANLHSHAFQYAMAGRTEHAGPGDGGDDFWSWRTLMYRFVARMTPDDFEAIAAQLYLVMLKAGYTAVGEFHYLHRQADGTPYADEAEMAHRIVAAAEGAGIGLALLPVFYAHAGFGGAPILRAQKPFAHSVESFLQLLSALRVRYGKRPCFSLGIAPHSLRAVTEIQLAALLEAAAKDDPTGRIHIHVAEQRKEVEDCLFWSGQRPVEWLLDHAPVDGRWCLVHATHMTDSETERAARSGAVAGLCPTTEANLGDGLFPAAKFLAAGGSFGIGSDSHDSVNLREELRWLEYGQRLQAGRRNILAGASGRSTASYLFTRAAEGGAAALGHNIGCLVPGARADLVVLDDRMPPLAGAAGDALLDAWLFAANDNPVRDVYVAGRAVVRDRHHPQEECVHARYLAAVKRLLG